jgi:circadian clock protein KaiC
MTNEFNETRIRPGKPVARQRMATGVAGLDEIMAGGLLNRATHLVAGAAGTGKTVLTQQLAFYQAGQGTNVLYLTFLSESHEKMISNLEGFSFFDRSLIGSRIQYLSFYHEVTANSGVEHLAQASRESVLKHKAKLVIVDGISSLRDFAASRKELRKALFDLNVQLSSLDCTVILIADDEQAPLNAPEYAVADSIIYLKNQVFKWEPQRTLSILKSRATSALGGIHAFDITSAGMVVYPRLEALLRNQKHDPPPGLGPTRYAFGIEGLDELMSGGLISGSVNMLLGTPGCGKSLTGLRFVYEGVRQGEKALVLSFHHSAERIRNISKRLGFDLSSYMENGSLRILWVLPVERSLDEVAGQLLKVVEEHQPTRLFIDALSDLEGLSEERDRLKGFWAVLTNYLRNRQVTTLGALELNRLIGSNLDIPERPISIIADTIILMRSLEVTGRLKHLISVLEMRESDYDSTIREYLISHEGLKVGEPFKDADQLLSGAAHPRQQLNDQGNLPK